MTCYCSISAATPSNMTEPYGRTILIKIKSLTS